MSESLEAPRLAEAVQWEQWHLRLSSQPHWIEPAVEYLQQRALLAGVCQESRAGKLLVALQEALTNAIVHGNLEIPSSLKEQGDSAFAQLLAARAADPAYAQRVVDIFVDYDGQRCQWAITDQGPGFDVETVLARCLAESPEVSLASGRGILLMRAFMDEVRYEAGGRRVILTLRKSSGSEQRRQPRQPVQLPLRLAPLRPDGQVDWEAAWTAVSRDLSPEGIGLLQERLATCDHVLLALPTEHETLYIPARVRHCRSVATGLVELGCSFDFAAASPTATEEVGQAIAQLLRARQRARPPQERRRHMRVPYHEPIQIVVGDRLLGAGYPRNLSKGGIAFIATAVPPAEFTLVFPARGDTPALRVQAALLRWTQVQEGFYDVAARFLSLAAETPPASPAAKKDQP